MAEGMVNMSRRERERMSILERVDRGELTLAAAAKPMKVSYRQAKRLFKRWREGGAAALIHAARGRPGNRCLDPDLRERALELARERYADYGPTLAAERLSEAHGIAVDHETLRRWMIEAGLWAGRRERRKHRRRRKRRERLGELVQIDASLHDWFEGRGAPCCLMVMIDDATGRRWAWFSQEETTEAAMLLLKEWIKRWGVPLALYADGKSVYFAQEGPTDFGAACAKLSIEMIRARSPQAKGRVERANGVFQDRLAKALREAGISAIDQANAFLPGFLEDLNAKLEKEPAQAEDFHRPADLYDLDAILCFEAQRAVSNDAVVRYKSRFFQLGQALRPGSKVTVRRRLDGRIQILSGAREIPWREIAAPPPRALAVAAAKPGRPSKPAPDHPWRKPVLDKARRAAAFKQRLLDQNMKSRRQKMKPGAPPPDPRSLSPCGHPHGADADKGGNPPPRRAPPRASCHPPRRSGRSSAEPYPPDGRRKS